MKKTEKIELLAPAGNLEKLKYAIDYGADAVYAGVPDFSLRVRINNFDTKTIKEGVEYAHKFGKKIYITLNIYAHNRHLAKIEKHLQFLKTLHIDGVIVSDPGIINLVKKYLPKVEIHLSTQANATNWQAIQFWLEQGVKRIILAREVTLPEIKEMRKKVPQAELEYFVHGAMCMAYSGRCILSKWMTNRSANLGDCSQPCRWKYDKDGDIYRMNVTDERKRFRVKVEEDRNGTYFFNSQDLNLIEYVDKLAEAETASLKIEGRAKSVYYLAVVVRAYRKVLDAVQNKVSPKELQQIIKAGKKELDGLTNRGYTQGFLLGGEPEHNYAGQAGNANEFKFVGQVEGAEGDLNIVKVHNAIFSQDTLEAIDPKKNYKLKIKKIYDYKMQEVAEAHGGHAKKYFFKFNKTLPEGALIRKK